MFALMYLQSNFVLLIACSDDNRSRHLFAATVDQLEVEIQFKLANPIVLSFIH